MDLTYGRLMQQYPAHFAITLAEAEQLERIADIIDSITERYKAVTTDGVQVIVSSSTIKDIKAALATEGLTAEAAAKLADDILTRRQWYTLLGIVDDNTHKLVNQLLLLCNNERRVIPLFEADDSNIPKHRATLQLNAELKYIPAMYYDTLRQILYLFDKRQQQPQGGFTMPTFRTIKQSPITNTLSKVYTARRKIPVDEFTGNATIARGDLIINITEYSKHPVKLKASTHRLLDAIAVKFTETGGKYATIGLPFNEYMQMCGLSDVKSAREQVIEDLDALYSLSLSWLGNDKYGNFVDVRLCGAKGIIENGIIVFNFSDPFYHCLLRYPIMVLPAGYFKLNAKRNPNSPAFLRRIAEHKNMNIAKANADTVSVKTLLQCAEGLPDYSEIQSMGGINQRIIEPFERDMDALTDTLIWEYCHSNGEPLTDSELESMNYHTFTELLVKVYWKEYPTRPLERAKERAAESKPVKRKRGRPKKTAD